MQPLLQLILKIASSFLLAMTKFSYQNYYLKNSHNNNVMELQLNESDSKPTLCLNMIVKNESKITALIQKY